MPTYDYVCSACGHKMEVIHGVHDRGPSTCPVCAGQLRKAFGAPAVVFKGTGWARKERAVHRPRRESSDDGEGDGKKAAKSSEADQDSSARPPSSGTRSSSSQSDSAGSARPSDASRPADRD